MREPSRSNRLKIICLLSGDSKMGISCLQKEGEPVYTIGPKRLGIWDRGTSQRAV